MCACGNKRTTVAKTGAQLKSAANGSAQRLIPRETPIKTTVMKFQPEPKKTPVPA